MIIISPPLYTTRNPLKLMQDGGADSFTFSIIDNYQGEESDVSTKIFATLKSTEVLMFI